MTNVSKVIAAEIGYMVLAATELEFWIAELLCTKSQADQPRAAAIHSAVAATNLRTLQPLLPETNRAILDGLENLVEERNQFVHGKLFSSLQHDGLVSFRVARKTKDDRIVPLKKDAIMQLRARLVRRANRLKEYCLDAKPSGSR